MLRIIFAVLIWTLPAFGAYANFRLLKVDHTQVVGADQTNFPVLVSGTFNGGGSLVPDLRTTGNGGKVQNASGFDVGFFTTSACSTKLDWETELYTAATGVSVYWVRIPTASSTVDTQFYLCYGDATKTTDQSNKTGVWDSDYGAVWHKPGATVSATDSTSNANDATAFGSTDGTGFINGGGVYSGSSQFLEYPSSVSSGPTGSMTLEAWVHPTDFSQYNAILSKTAGNKPNPYEFRMDVTTGLPVMTVGDGVSFGGAAGTAAPTANVWSYMATTYTSGTTAIAHYLNNATNGGTTVSTTISNSVNPGQIGSRQDHNTMFKGSMDEVRLSRIARSSNWIFTTYNTTANPSTFITIGAENGASSAPVNRAGAHISGGNFAY